MPRLTDPDILARYRYVLSNWQVEGYVEFVGRAEGYLRAELEGITQRLFRELLHRYVFVDGGKIDQVKEDRERWRDQWEFHYDLRLIVNGIALYVETRLFPESLVSSADPMIYVVNIHPV